MVTPAAKTNFVPIKVPHFVYDPAVTQIVLLSSFQGSVYVLGRQPDATVTVLEKITCASLSVNFPDPIFARVSSFIDVNSLDVILCVVPTSMSDNQVTTQVAALL